VNAKMSFEAYCAVAFGLACFSGPLLAETDLNLKMFEKANPATGQGRIVSSVADKEKRWYEVSLAKAGYDRTQYEKDLVWYAQQLNYNGLREIHFQCYGDGEIGDYCYGVHFWNEAYPSRNDYISLENGQYLKWPQGMAKGLALELVRRRVNVYRYEVVKGMRKSVLAPSEDRQGDANPRKVKAKRKFAPLHDEYKPTAKEQAAIDAATKSAIEATKEFEKKKGKLPVIRFGTTSLKYFRQDFGAEYGRVEA